MTPDQIERETTIDAPVERVWALLTEAEHIAGWFADAGAEIDLRPGGAIRALGEHGSVTRADRGGRAAARFAYRWARASREPGGDEPADGNSTLVEFTLAPEGDGTRLRVVESGFAALDDATSSASATTRTTPAAGPQMLRRAGRVRGAGGGLTAAPSARGLHRARRPDALARARRCSPSAARRPRRRWPASCRSAASRSSSTSRCSTAPASSRAAARAARCATRCAPSSSARPRAGWPASRPQWDARLAAIKRMAEEG